MRHRIDLDRAAAAEVVGALAARRPINRGVEPGQLVGRTVAQRRALEELLTSLVDFARKSGAKRRVVKLGNVSLKLTGQGAEEVLSVHKLAAA